MIAEPVMLHLTLGSCCFQSKDVDKLTASASFLSLASEGSAASEKPGMFDVHRTVTGMSHFTTVAPNKSALSSSNTSTSCFRYSHEDRS